MLFCQNAMRVGRGQDKSIRKIQKIWKVMISTFELVVSLVIVGRIEGRLQHEVIKTTEIN
jgi:hypothetical protein